MSDYYFDQKKQFIIDDYHQKKTFSSFLPGIAGEQGIPIWAFYVNRGQGISSFGIQDKDHSMMEFFPANGAYRFVSTYGFRTFIKFNDGHIIEPFIGTSDQNKRKMAIRRESFFLEENVNDDFVIRVNYTTMVNQPFGGLIRQVTIENLQDTSIEFEIVDGMATILPYGISTEDFKAMSNLMRSFMIVEHPNTIPFYKMKTSTKDEAEVTDVNQGFFFLGDAKESPLIIDPDTVFGYSTDLKKAVGFQADGFIKRMENNQVNENKVPCALQYKQVKLSPGESVVINSIYGYSDSFDKIERFEASLDRKVFIQEQFKQVNSVIEELCAKVETHTAFPVFDEYIKQSYLDNIMRGGFPLVFDGKNQDKVYHIYSRKHGDPERDYNFFSIEPSYYSQGNGNYRDVNQNRRSDILFNPKIKEFNIWQFYNLIQADGYNPLKIEGVKFIVQSEEMDSCMEALDSIGVSQQSKEKIHTIIQEQFTPGDLSKVLARQDIQSVIETVIYYSEQRIDADFGEGYWSDHFTYNQDLLESYKKVYPDKMESLLFEQNKYRYYHSPFKVRPRVEKYGVTRDGKVRQYGALESIAKDSEYKGQWMTDKNGQIIHTTLFNKLLTLVCTKFLNLDPEGMGLEMEAEKPGWNDAMNGLPGLFGSGMSESIELLRIVQFLIQELENISKETISILKDTNELADQIIKNKVDDAMNWWIIAGRIKEAYRDKTCYYLNNIHEDYKKEKYLTLFIWMQEKLQTGINKAKDMKDGLIPTFFVYEANQYEVIDGTTPYGLKKVDIHSFIPRALPAFLEAPARLLKISSKEEAQILAMKIKASDIYDQELKMYKTSAHLDDETIEIGRIRAFTPGWLERESVFLHMTYKYLLGLIQAGAIEEYMEAIKTNFIPFLNPERYGRPVTENSSFLASSRNPDESVRGQGFVARLSGSTAEALHIWYLMFVGMRSVEMQEGQLRFSFEPVLPGEFFDENGKVTFTLFGHTQVTYINKKRENTYGDKQVKVRSITIDGKKSNRLYLADQEVERLREQSIEHIAVIFD